MHSVFAQIEFGPFKSEYHKTAVDVDFREALSEYLVAELLPQVDEPFDSSAGTVHATFDDQKYCGPNSAVRDLYSLEIEFRRRSSVDGIKIDLAYSQKKRSFSPRFRGKPLYLWTAARKEAQGRQNESIQVICGKIQRGEVASAHCPCCGSELRIINSAALFDVSCPGNCFNYNFHRDSQTGVFQHGHFFSKPPING